MNKETKQLIISFIFLTLGSVVAAFALEEFLVPNKVFDGGVTGICMILNHFIPVKLGLLVIIINIPFIMVALKKLGKMFIIKAIYSLIVFSVMTTIFEPVPELTDDIILAVTFGAVFLGIGVGLVLRGGGVLDGTEIVAVMLSRKLSISTGQIILIFNVVIYFIAGCVFGLDRGMYSLLMYFITSKVIDIVEIGWNNTKAVMIITDKGKVLADEIYKQLGRTVTFMKGEGLVSKDEKDILYCVVTRAEIHDLKNIINNAGGSSFSAISDVSEIIGRHIKTGE